MVRYLKIPIITVIIILIIELGVYFKNQDDLYKKINRDVILDLKYQKQDPFLKYLLGFKSYALSGLRADFLQFGDSSGFHAIRPNIVEEYLDGLRFINTSCCAVTVWDGYLSLARHYLRNLKEVKYLVFYVTPYALPVALNKKYGDGYSERLYDLYSSKWRLFHKLPSTYYRKDVVESVYRKNDREKNIGEFIKKTFLYINGVAKKDSNGFFIKNYGWMPLVRDPKTYAKMPLGECGEEIIEHYYDKKSGRSILVSKLQQVKGLADEYGKKLIIIFNPVSCKVSKQIKPLFDDLENFKKRNPDIYIPFDIITTRDKSYFADQWHLNPYGSRRFSHNVGKKLQEFIKTEKRISE